MKSIKPFSSPLYTTRPILPNLNEFHNKLEEIWASKWLTNEGKQHQLLEKEIQNKLDVPYVSLFNNGTIALIIACQSLRLSGEVITTPFTFAATPHVLVWNNIKPIFCDIDPVTMNIDADLIESLITPQTTAILPVHVFGTPCDVYKIQDIADRYGLRVIYDAAHAFGVEIDGKGIGSFGDISMFSFHATKMYHTAEGGALTFNDKNLKTRIDFLKNFGIKNEEEIVMPGINGKMNELQAALGLLVLELFDEERKQRKVLEGIYQECLENVPGISLVRKEQSVKDNAQYFIIRINELEFGKSRDHVHEELKKFNVFARKYFYPLCSDFPCYAHLPSSSKARLPSAHIIAREVLCLPLYGELSEDDVEKICTVILNIKKKCI